jgi:hypothetical protein
MQKQEVEAYLGKLVTVELISGPVLTETLAQGLDESDSFLGITGGMVV